MKDLVNIVCWSFLFASAAAISEFVSGKPGKFPLTIYWKKTSTLRVVRAVPILLAILTGALVIWGWCNLSWYAALLEFFTGAVFSAFVLQQLNPLPRIYFGWIVVLATVLWLWINT
ncbi:MAG TPA: hypothetical protein VEL06_03100 [Haliangiales bacterium]|nr:hypothetical protein [Haliangiales bacterium]